MIGEDLQKFSESRVMRTIAIGRVLIRNLPNRQQRKPLYGEKEFTYDVNMTNAAQIIIADKGNPGMAEKDAGDLKNLSKSKNTCGNDRSEGQNGSTIASILVAPLEPSFSHDASLSFLSVCLPRDVVLCFVLCVVTLMSCAVERSLIKKMVPKIEWILQQHYTQTNALYKDIYAGWGNKLLGKSRERSSPDRDLWRKETSNKNNCKFLWPLRSPDLTP
ncbi:hypothetical protein AVEN_89194-1 [Araneus ventricosus]|uniref:Uncharacterized protein n=1 Tax=Araneus ventricosus TaxID=182803 RepID=A0A4Y2GS92_ARAVE|nr:hypothetical protein AVEN_89194-1 [Araneus ventricosus]